MKNINLILLSICLILSCSSNKASVFYTDVNKIYSDVHRKIYDSLTGKEKSEKEGALYLERKINELKAIPDFVEGNNLKLAMENEISLWKEIFELSEKINHANLTPGEKNALVMKRLKLQMQRNPLNGEVEKENNLFADKFDLEPLNTLVKIKARD